MINIYEIFWKLVESGADVELVKKHKFDIQQIIYEYGEPKKMYVAASMYFNLQYMIGGKRFSVNYSEQGERIMAPKGEFD